MRMSFPPSNHEFVIFFIIYQSEVQFVPKITSVRFVELKINFVRPFLGIYA